MRDLPATNGTEVYETWVIVGDAAPVPVGDFKVDANGHGDRHDATDPGAAGRHRRRFARAAARQHRAVGPIVSTGVGTGPVELTWLSRSAAGVASSEPRPSVPGVGRPPRERPPTIDSASVPSLGKRATPAETVIRRPSVSGSAAMSVEHAPGNGHARPSRRNDDELVAAEASDGVDEPDRPGDDRRDGAQDVVARLAAGGVVRGREVVDVEDRNRDLAALPPGAGELQLEDPRERPHVGEAGERIRVGEPLEPLRSLGDRRGRAGSGRPRPRRGPRRRAGTRSRRPPERGPPPSRTRSPRDPARSHSG